MVVFAPQAALTNMPEENLESRSQDTAEEESDEEAKSEDSAGEESSDSTPTVPKEKYDELYGRMKRYESELKTFKTEKKTQPETPPQPKSTDEMEERVELRLQGFSRDEVAEISTYAKAKNISLSEAAKNDFVMAGIQAIRAKAKSQEATPSPSKRGTVMDSAKLSKMSPADKAREFSFDSWKAKKRTGNV